MNEKELEDKIWDNTAFRNHKTEIWRKVGGHKKTCFDKIDEMVTGGRLEEDQQGTKMMYRRKDTIKKAEFDFGFTFQVNMIEQSRSIAKKTKKPLFKLKSGMLKSSGKPISPYRFYKARTEKIQSNFDNMRFYYGGLLLFICRANLQRSLGMISKSVAEERIKKCESAIENHFKKLLDENPTDSSGIMHYFQERIHEIERFSIH